MKRLFITLGILFIIGGAGVWIYGFYKADFNFKHMSMQDYEEKTVALDSVPDNITVEAYEGDVSIIGYDGDTVKIEYSQSKYREVSIVGDKELTVKRANNAKKWYLHLINFTNAQFIKVYLPASFAGNVDIDSGAGKVNLNNLACADITINVAAGDVKLNDISGENVAIEVYAGDVDFNNLACKNISINIAAGDVAVSLAGATVESIDVQLLAGDIFLDDVTANKTTLNVSSGAIDFTGLTSPDINIKLSLGDVTGSIIGKKSDYKIDIKIAVGSSNITENVGLDKLIKINVEVGDVNLSFIEE